MDINSLLILLAIGVAAGVLSGIVGIGGGIVIVPALIYFWDFHKEWHKALRWLYCYCRSACWA